MLILHGVRPDHRHMVETCEPVFADLPGWRRIYVDMPGHGQSGTGDGIDTQEDLLKAVLGFAAETFPGQSLALIGRSRASMSGYLDAVDALPADPRATLAVLDTAGHDLAWERPELFEALMRDWLARLAAASG